MKMCVTSVEKRVHREEQQFLLTGTLSDLNIYKRQQLASREVSVFSVEHLGLSLDRLLVRHLKLQCQLLTKHFDVHKRTMMQLSN